MLRIVKTLGLALFDTKTNKQRSAIVRFFNLLVQILLYIPIQIVFIPFAIIGIIIASYKEFRIGKKLGVSFSAVQTLQNRWFMHYFDTRPDSLSVAFIKNFPCESHFGLYSTFGALIIAQRYFGLTTKLGKVDELGEETIVSTTGRRLLLFDSIMERYVDDVDQIVIPGAGFDLIALRYTEDKDVNVFELDQVNTINVKVKTLEQAGIQHDWITYIPVDYSTESWVDKLQEAGFDNTKKTLFLWQSVSLFLDADLVQRTLRDMADLCADESIIAQDLYSEAFISGKISKSAKKTSRMMEEQGEPWKFGIDMSDDPRAAVGSFLNECRLEMTEYYQFGEKRDLEPFYCIVEANIRKPENGS